MNDLSLNPLRGERGTSLPPVATPHIDSIGEQGLIFTRAYAAHATCAPSRVGLLTGREPQRFGLEFNPGSDAFASVLGKRSYSGIPGLFFEDRLGRSSQEAAGLPTSEVTLGELARAHGYRTGQFGKWHLGVEERYLPGNQGFDRWTAFLAGFPFYLPKDDPRAVNAPLPIDAEFWMFPNAPPLRNGVPVEADRLRTDLYADEAIEFIRSEDDDRPFFAYLAFLAPHNPLQALKSDYDAIVGVEDHETRVYYAMIRALDRAIGRVLDALRESGQMENTVIVFTSDNGGADYTEIWTHNQPLRGFKASFWEGGIRVPLFIRWDGAIAARGQMIETPVSLLDLFPTFDRLMGPASVTTAGPLDGRALLTEEGGLLPRFGHEELFWRAGEAVAYLGPQWKLIATPRPEPGRVWLYSVGEGPAEDHNLAKARPDIVESLLDRVRDHFDPMPPPRNVPAFEMPVRAEPPVPGDFERLDELDYMYWPG
ncbi:MAG: sulfatase-like hydrolase/transferase [Alphaproteobacteria bacterium]|nr:sulfatase-like hydrolase/transferase [Alphaproteobacteria bacterium]